jgi:hypothetical protein
VDIRRLDERRNGLVKEFLSMDAEPRAFPSRRRTRQHLRDERCLAAAGRRLDQHAATTGLHRGAALRDQRVLVVAED